jgi:hypothetical protein
MSKLTVFIASLSFPILASSLEAQCNSAPVAVNDVTEFIGKAISVQPMWNDSEPNGEALELSVVGGNCSSPPVGPPISVVLDNGTLRLIPTQAGYATSCTVTYQIEDERGFTDTALIQVHVGGDIFRDGFESGNTAKWH